ncbi:hypothetical protein ACX80I_17125 [Arthrobacter sp. MDT3-44]
MKDFEVIEGVEVPATAGSGPGLTTGELAVSASVAGLSALAGCAH